MLSLQLVSGEYITIGDDIVVQVFQGSGDRIQVHVKAPQEVPIVRGTVRERSGESRPKDILRKEWRPKSPSEKYHSAKSFEKMTEGREEDALDRAIQKISTGVAARLK